jgi:ATP-binding cassette, subfamily B, bacterial
MGVKGSPRFGRMDRSRKSGGDSRAGRELLTTRASRDVLGRGLRVLGRAIRTEPGLFTIGTIGSSFFGLLIIANAYVVGAVIGHVVVPAFAERRAGAGTLGLIAAVFIGISCLRVATIFGRRLGAGYMQYRLQARYRRAVTRRYLSLPPAWHQRHATGSLLSNANSDV